MTSFKIGDRVIVPERQCPISHKFVRAGFLFIDKKYYSVGTVVEVGKYVVTVNFDNLQGWVSDRFINSPKYPNKNGFWRVSKEYAIPYFEENVDPSEEL